MSLLIIDCKTADIAIKKHYKKVSVLEEDVERTFTESDTFIIFINKRIERLKIIASKKKEM